MTTYTIHLQETGQNIEVPEAIGKDDLQVRRALTGTIPYIETAKLERKKEGDVETITVNKSHGSKGGGDNPIPFQN
jgi:hypothetical protein